MALQLRPGDALGTYTVVRPLSGGGTSEGYLVERNDGLGQRFAKVFTSITVGDRAYKPERVAEFEFFQQQLLEKLNTVVVGARILESFVFGRHFVKIMQLLQGEELTRFLVGAPPNQQGEVAVELLRVLAAVHRVGVANLDLKPDNAFVILLPGGHLSVRLIDFDIGWVDCLDPHTRQKFRRSAYFGTPGYLPPEYLWWAVEQQRQVEARQNGREARPIRHYPELAADVFQAGLILFEIFVKRSAFAELNGQEPALVVAKVARNRANPLMGVIARRRRDFPSGVPELLERMLVADPQARPTMAEAHQDLARALQQPPPQPRPAPVPAPAPVRRVGTSLTYNGRVIAQLEAGRATQLGAALLPAWGASLGMIRSAGTGWELMAYVDGVTVNGQAVRRGAQAHPLAPGARIAFRGVEVVMT